MRTCHPAVKMIDPRYDPRQRLPLRDVSVSVVREVSIDFKVWRSVHHLDKCFWVFADPLDMRFDVAIQTEAVTDTLQSRDARRAKRQVCLVCAVRSPRIEIPR